MKNWNFCKQCNRKHLENEKDGNQLISHQMPNKNIHWRTDKLRDTLLTSLLVMMLRYLGITFPTSW